MGFWGLLTGLAATKYLVSDNGNGGGSIQYVYTPAQIAEMEERAAIRQAKWDSTHFAQFMDNASDWVVNFILHGERCWPLLITGIIVLLIGCLLWDMRSENGNINLGLVLICTGAPIVTMYVIIGILWLFIPTI